MSEYCNNCFCCGYYLVPRYKRLVNNIFSQNPQHGLDKNNLERLRFYAVLKPEKLEKSFRYMSEKIERYLRNRNRPYVILGIKAMNDTMKSCYQQLNTFVKYYLVTLHLVLEERNDLELTEHAVDSFESFCEIREEAPNYQRNYEFFVDRFTQLCHYNEEDNQKKFRCLGLRGNRAFIQKTANDELQNDVWKYMDQIVPSIIFNMEIREQNQLPATTVSSEDVVIIDEDPSILAENVLKDLFSRTHLNNISTCIQPILIHLDNHKKWIPVNFPKYIFSIIMNSIKNHNSYVIIDLLLNHLEKYFDQKQTTNIKTSIMNVIHDCLVFAATHTGAGSTMFAAISNLLKFLKRSFQIKILSNNDDEHEFQKAIINGIGDFAEKLPDFQMMEIMQYIVTSLATLNQDHDEKINNPNTANFKFQLLLLQTVHKITLEKRSRQSTSTENTTEQNYETTTFPHQLFDPLLKLMSTSDSEIRLMVLKILQLLIDRRHYAEKFQKIRIPKDISQLELSNESKITRPFDIAFMKKYGRQFLSQLHQCLLMTNNTKEIFYAIYCLMNLITLEASDQDALVDVIHFCFEIQSTIIKITDENQRKFHYCIHALIAAYFYFISKFYQITEFSHHVDQIIHYRELHASYLLPPNAFRTLSKEDLIKSIPKECLFSEEIVINALKALDYDVSRFNRIIPIKTELDASAEKDYDNIETDDSISSTIDLRVESQNEDISYQTICNVINRDQLTRVRNDENKRLIKEFRTKPFEELKSRANEKQKQTDQRIEQLLNVRYLPKDKIPIQISNSNLTLNENSNSDLNNFQYPDLFTY